MPYKTLIDLYTAILKGTVDPSTLIAIMANGNFTIYPKEGGDALFEGYYGDAIDFAGTILRIECEIRGGTT